jgi:hypothetical protein
MPWRGSISGRQKWLSVLAPTMNRRAGPASFIRMTIIKFSGKVDANAGEGLATSVAQRFDFKGAVDRAIKRTRSA